MSFIFLSQCYSFIKIINFSECWLNLIHASVFIFSHLWYRLIWMCPSSDSLPRIFYSIALLYWIFTARSVLFHSWFFLSLSHMCFYALSLPFAFTFTILIFLLLFRSNNFCTWNIRFFSNGLVLMRMLTCCFYRAWHLFLSCSRFLYGLFPNEIKIWKFFGSTSLSIMCSLILSLAYSFISLFLHIMNASKLIISVISFFPIFFIYSLILTRLCGSYK